MEKRTIPVVGMACSACSANVEKKLNSLPGIKSAAVNLPGRTALVEYNPEEISLERMKNEINAIGYDLVIETNRSAEAIERRELQRLKRRTALSWGFALLCMCVSMGWLNLGGKSMNNQVALLLALANFVVCGGEFFSRAWRQLRHGSANMDSLVALSTSIAFLFSTFNTFWGDAVWGARGIVWHTYFDASVMIITFVLTGRLLEERAKNETAGSIRQLMGLAPKTARLIDGDEMRDVPIATIAVGDVLEVRAGEKVPVDGVVTMAESFMTADGAYIDESMITGEPTPALKQKGAKVLAGTVVSQGKFRFKAQQIGEHTALAQIIKMVQEAQGSKAPVQRVVDRVARVFVPVVALIALLTFLLWWLLGGNAALPQAIISAVAVLVIACPCAMGLATPTALMVAIGKAAQMNVLIKDAAALESLKGVNAMVIDKTGTLTIPNQNIDFTKADDLPLEMRESLKPHAEEAMAELQNMGIAVYMMSGDKDEAARYWAEKAGIGHYRSKVLPQDKENMVRQLQAEGKRVAMVGDGINDTQALALADVGIAMGRGTDVAMDAAQATLMGDDLRRLPQAIRLSKKTTAMIGQNLFWAFIYNVVCIPLAAGVLHLFDIDFQITPMWASALMAFSSVSVVLNSLRLKLAK
ncbi:heavy metal translocating P-type ATPase [Hoylesella loescheii]|uniref:P-type Cu(+) transporter n=1 Tax=Hoylesella loescheii DSM 19665 = JCM 12249 = ATCC 15930 TaxID=1122985 RepID=A0A069QGL5_HOYLO|nr:heavy metal translocating P-type ATPase [Hoylesella loescheii]KDR51822.1 copper-exporting ATPase [Hoylesella loescheii DSM 19665 = JCM 12249 = ATCC 15930]